MEQKKNDWVATLFFNSDKSLQELANLGFTVENSDIKDKSYYKLKPEIQQAFVKENGEFNEVEFNNFYNSALELYNDEENKNMEVSIMSNFEYDPDDPLAPVGSKRWDKTASIVHYANPMRQSRGIKNLNSWGAPTMSMREVGQMNKIFNPETGEFEDKTPNDLSFWDVMGSNLVLASWDEDGTHEENGRIIQHKKGDLKFNEEGDAYYEYLNGRNIAGKELLHITDVLTEDGSKWNKYDFFDADGLDKSVSGTIARTLLTIAPSFIPYVGGAYAIAGITLELGKLIPELYNSVEGILGGDSSNNHLSNDIQAWFTKFDYNTTDEGRQHMWNIENIGKMISSSSMQLVQQKMIGKLPALINGNKYSENAIKWGRGLSLSYMAGTSATGTFEAFKEAGTSDFVAGLGSLASMMAMGKLMNSDYFRDIWYKGTPLARGEFKKAIKDAAKEVQKSIDVGTLTTKKGQTSFLKRASDTIVKYFEKIQNNDLLASAASEGLEETMEEVSFDFIKGTTNALNSLGIIGRGTDYDFGFSLESMMSRYFSSAVGGALGGAVFNLHNRTQNFFDGVTNDVAKREGFQELIYLIRNNRTGELKSELERWHKKGKLGSTNLSGVEGEIVQNETGSGIVYSHAKDGESQNDIIFKQISNMIDRVEGVLNEENLKISDIELQMIRQNSEDDLSTLSDDDIRFLWKNKFLDYREEELGKESGLVSGIFQEWNMLSNDIVSAKIQLEEMLKPKESEPKTPSDVDAHIAAVKKSSDYKYWSDKLKKLRERRDAIVKGERHNYYTGQLNFALMPEIAKTFGAIVGKNQFALYKFGKKYDELSDDDKKIADELYAKYSPNEKNAAFRAYDIYYNLTQTFKDDINETSDKLEKYSSLFSGMLYGDMVSSNIDKEIQSRENLIQLERKLENPDEEKISTWQKEIANFKLQKIQSILSRDLSDEGREQLDRTQTNPNVADYINNYVSWLEYLNSNNLFLEENDYEYKRIVGYVADLYESRLNHLKKLERDGVISSVGSNYLWNFEKIVEQLKGGNISALKELDDLLYAIENGEEGFSFPSIILGKLSKEDEDKLYELFSDYLKTSISINNTSFSLVSAAEQISGLRNQIKHSPIHDLLEKILVDINPDLVGAMNMVLSEMRNLSNVKDIEDYIINSPAIVEKLKTISDLLPIISALVNNRDIIPGESDGISDASVQVMNKELSILGEQIASLISIAEANNAQKLVEQDKIKINMRQRFADILINKSSLVAKKLGEKFGFSVPELVDQIGFNFGEINDSNYAEYEQKVIALENEIYSKIWKSGKSVTEIVEIFFSIFNSDDIKSRVSTKMTKDPTIKVESYDQLMYLFNIIAFPSSNFYNLYKEKVANLKLAPIFAQEFAVKSVYGFLQSPDLLNAVLHKMGDKSIWGEIEKNDPDLYLKTKRILYNFLPFISGGAGAGKTAGVDKIIYDMLGDEWEKIAVAPEDTQSENLANNLGHNGIKKTINQLVKEITGEEGIVYEPLSRNGTYLRIDLNTDTKVNKDTVFPNNGKKKVVFIDEYSLIDGPTLQLISKWAHENGILIIPSGDRKQNPAILNTTEFGVFQSGVEDCHALHLPELTVSLRAGSVAKVDNYNCLNRVLALAMDYYTKNPSSGTERVSTYFVENILPHNKIRFKYFNKDGKFDGGEKLVDSNEIDAYIEEISKKTDNYVVIHNGQAKYENKGNDPHYIDRRQVQGKEYEYVIIDIDWSKGINGENRTVYPIVTDLYSLSQRSTKGSIIRNTGLSSLNIEVVEDDSSSILLTMNEEQIAKYKEKRLKELSIIPNDMELRNKPNSLPPVNPPTTPPSSNSESTSTSGNQDSSEDDDEEEETHSVTSEVEDDDDVPSPINELPPLEELEEDPIISNSAENNEDDSNELVEHATSSVGDSAERNTKGRVINNGTRRANALTAIGLDANATEKLYIEWNGVSGNTSRLSNYLWLLKSWFLFGYYQKDKNGVILKERIGKSLFDKIEFDVDGNISNVKFRIRDEYIVAMIEKDGTTITIPLLNKPESLNYWDDSFEFELWNHTSLEHEFHTTEYDANYKNNVVISQPRIFHIDESAYLSSEDRNNSDDFRVRNEGRTMKSVCFDPFVSREEEDAFWSSSQIKKTGEYWGTNQDNRFVLVGFNIHAFNMDQLKEVLNNYINNPLFKGKHIISRFTLHGILRTLLIQSGPNALIEIMKSFDTYNKYLQYKLHIGKYNNDNAREIYNESIDIFKTDGDGKVSLTEEFINIIKSDKQELHFIKAYESKGNKQYWDANPTDFIKAICSAYYNGHGTNEAFNIFKGQLKNGIKINDEKSFDNKVNDEGDWYEVERNPILPYSTDIVNPPKPIFRIKKRDVIPDKSKQSEEEKEMIDAEIRATTLDDAIKKAIIEEYGESYFNNISLSNIRTINGCENGKIKIISLNLQYGNGVKIINAIIEENNGEIKVISKFENSGIIRALIGLQSDYFRKWFIGLPIDEEGLEDAITELAEIEWLNYNPNEEFEQYKMRILDVAEEVFKNKNCE